jgi:hypothetical protein
MHLLWRFENLPAIPVYTAPSTLPIFLTMSDRRLIDKDFLSHCGKNGYGLVDGE